MLTHAAAPAQADKGFTKSSHTATAAVKPALARQPESSLAQPASQDRQQHEAIGAQRHTLYCTVKSTASQSISAACSTQMLDTKPYEAVRPVKHDKLKQMTRPSSATAKVGAVTQSTYVSLELFAAPPKERGWQREGQ
jgi:hypothetical protein